MFQGLYVEDQLRDTPYSYGALSFKGRYRSVIVSGVLDMDSRQTTMHMPLISRFNPDHDSKYAKS